MRKILELAAPIMEAWAKSHELDEWHCMVEDLIGTAYPHRLLPQCAGCNVTGKTALDYCDEIINNHTDDFEITSEDIDFSSNNAKCPVAGEKEKSNE